MVLGKEIHQRGKLVLVLCLKSDDVVGLIVPALKKLEVVKRVLGKRVVGLGNLLTVGQILTSDQIHLLVHLGHDLSPFLLCFCEAFCQKF